MSQPKKPTTVKTTGGKNVATPHPATQSNKRHPLFTFALIAASLAFGLKYILGLGLVAGVKTAMLYSIADNGRKSGRADGNVYMRNGRVRGMRVPALVRNAYTATARGIFSSFSSGWASLTSAQQRAWIDFIGFTSDRFGRQVEVKGKTAYVRLNVNLANTVQAAITDPPIDTAVESVILTAVTIDLSDTSMEVAYDATVAGKAYIMATAPLRSGIYRPSQSAFRLIGTFDPTAAGPVDVWTSYVAKFGTPPVGSKIFVQVVNVNLGGIASPRTQSDGIVVA